MGPLRRFIPEILILLGLLVLHAWAYYRVRARNARSPIAVLRWGLFLALSASVLTLGVAFDAQRIASHFPAFIVFWIRTSSTFWKFLCLVAGPMLAAVDLLLVPWARHNPGRRHLLRNAQAIALGAPVAALGYGTFIERTNIHLNEIRIPFADLPKDLDGLRIVQVSDVHLSEFLSERELAYAIDLANETKAHIAVMTGDLISSLGDPIDTCLKQLARLKSDAGTLGCLGNHEIYAYAEEYAQQEGAKLGIAFLRSEARTLQFGGRRVRFAGVDYQTMRSPYLVGAEKLIEPGAFNIMLSHNPDVFPVAARQGYHLTLSGHTHGGQVNVEILHQDVSMARFYTPYVKGVYRKGQAAAYVTRGVGTVGMPVRIGAPPEVSLIQLCAT